MWSRNSPPWRPSFLASVQNATEARQALACGADYLDCKDPSQGSLGAVSPDVVREIVDARGSSLVSATLGDLPNDPDLVAAVARNMEAAGVQFVKWGVFEREGTEDVARALDDALSDANKAAVLMADREPDFDLIPLLARQNFHAIILDTADKSKGPLRTLMSEARLREFVERVDQHEMLCGLAGSLRLEDIGPLSALGSNILGFRGALCHDGRTSGLDPAKVSAVRSAIDATAADLDRGRRRTVTVTMRPRSAAR